MDGTKWVSSIVYEFRWKTNITFEHISAIARFLSSPEFSQLMWASFADSFSKRSNLSWANLSGSRENISASFGSPGEKVDSNLMRMRTHELVLCGSDAPFSASYLRRIRHSVL